MANKSQNLSALKTIREFLDSQLVDGAKIYIKSSDGSDETLIENIDVIWDGTNYYLSYTTTTTTESTTETTTETITTTNTTTNTFVVDLDSVLPFRIEVITSESVSTPKPDVGE